MEQPEEGFAWGYFAAAVIGIVLTIAVVCTLANTFKKGPAAERAPAPGAAATRMG